MDAQTVSVVIAVASSVVSVLVVLINTGSNLLTKRIDTKEKKEDRNQELRKIYVARKIEAGEAVIGRWTLLLSKLSWFEHQYSSNEFETLISPDYYTSFRTEDERLNQLIQPTNYNDKNYYYFYFEHEMVSADNCPLTSRHHTLRKALEYLLSEVRGIYHMLENETITTDKTRGNLYNSLMKKQQQFESALPLYLEANTNLKNLMLESASKLRKHMARYDLPV